MIKTKKMFAFLFLATITLIFAGCGDNSTPTISVLSVTTASLPAATAGTAYSQVLAASGGTTPYIWSISAGALPAGLSLNASTGAISGTPTTVATSNFTVKVTDSATPVAGTATMPLSIAVAAPAALTVTTASPLPAATIGTAYSQTFAASGGTSPYTWALASGSAALPAGLTLTAGVISGTPTSAGTVSVNIMVTDAAAATATKVFSITVGTTQPPAFDALTFYTTNCKGCHTLGVRTAAQITAAIAAQSAMSQFRAGGANALTAAQITAIAAVSF